MLGAILLVILIGIYEVRYGFKIPEPTGPHPVGVKDLIMTDSSRESHEKGRRLLVRLYYPVAAASGTRVPYFPDPGIANNLAEMMDVPLFTVSHLKYGRTNATFDPAPAILSNLPLIIFSHGLNGMRAQNTYLLEDLASHGYLVAGIEHHGFSIGSIFPDGTLGEYSKKNELSHPDAGRDIITTWSKDQEFVHNQLIELNNQNKLFQEKQNLGKTGLLGHSFGGATSFHTVSLENNFTAAINMDGFYFGKDPKAGTNKPIMEIRAEPLAAIHMNKKQLKSAGLTPEIYEDMMFTQWEERFREYAQGEAYRYVFKGANHLSFTDLVLGVPFKSILMKDHDFYHKKTRMLVKDFFDKTLKDQPLENSLKTASNNRPEVLTP